MVKKKEREEITRIFPHALKSSFFPFLFPDNSAPRFQQKNTEQKKKTAVLFYCRSDMIFFISWPENILPVVNKIIKHCQFVISYKSNH